MAAILPQVGGTGLLAEGCSLPIHPREAPPQPDEARWPALPPRFVSTSPTVLAGCQPEPPGFSRTVPSSDHLPHPQGERGAPLPAWPTQETPPVSLGSAQIGRQVHSRLSIFGHSRCGTPTTSAPSSRRATDGQRDADPPASQAVSCSRRRPISPDHKDLL